MAAASFLAPVEWLIVKIDHKSSAILGRVVNRFRSHARTARSKVVFGPKGKQAVSTLGANLSDRSPNRHLTIKKQDFSPSGVVYTEFFAFLDQHLRPAKYFEIGTHLGNSLKAFRCDAVCVDPEFKLAQDVLSGRRQTHFFQMTSDDFFAEQDLQAILKGPPNICFLDGMHRAEYLLRDFYNTERACSPESIIFMHDCLPSNFRMTLRTHEMGDDNEGPWKHAWTGDVWKIVPLLKTHRPDLDIKIFDCAPTGLVAVSNLDPGSTKLKDMYSSLVGELRAFDLEKHTIERLWSEVPVVSSRSLVDFPEDLTLFVDVR
jgi:hypothetical protein